VTRSFQENASINNAATLAENEGFCLKNIIEEDNSIMILTEITGINKSDIKLDTTETHLKLSINTPQCKLFKEILLPTGVIPESAKAWYKNGILEIKITKEKVKFVFNVNKIR
jgi:HSP20 family protein